MRLRSRKRESAAPPDRTRNPIIPARLVKSEPGKDGEGGGLSGKVVCGIGMRLGRGRLFKLHLGERFQVRLGAVVPAELARGIRASPAEKKGVPRHPAVHVHWRLVNPIGRRA